MRIRIEARVMDEFPGKVALVTGAGRGIGRDAALAFSSLGVKVAVNDINPILVDEVVEQISDLGGFARGYVFDIAKRMPIEGMLSQVLDDFTRLDILVNHASVEPSVPILDMDEWEFHRTLDVNLGGPFFCIQQAGRMMKQAGGGAIINIVSVSGKDNELKSRAAYITSQVGLLGLTSCAAAELSAANIRVNAICHGISVPDFLVAQDGNEFPLQPWRESLSNLGLGDHPETVCLVLYLCSTAGASIRGQVISIDH